VSYCDFNLLVSRWLLEALLMMPGEGVLWLGVFEIMTPETFGEKGGGFLENLCDLR
jgi:hypothetical protein